MAKYLFPAIRGVQAQREYYVIMCRLSLIPKLFMFDEEELPAELRAQRTLNQNRIPGLKHYLVDNPEDYVFSSLTASVDGDLHFEPALEADEEKKVGVLHVPMTCDFIINDGQHRRAAIEASLRERPELGREHISVVLFRDRGLERSQQMFADLNRYAIRPSPSLGILYDQRDVAAQVTKNVVAQCEPFRGLVENERTTLSPRARKLFTLSALHAANLALLGDGLELEGVSEATERSVSFWTVVAEQLPEWGAVQRREMSAGELRRDGLNSHGVVLQSLGRVGFTLMHAHPRSWADKLSRLRNVDWSRSNTAIWEGRAMIAGHVSKSRRNVALTTSYLKTVVGLELTDEEERLEAAAQDDSTP